MLGISWFVTDRAKPLARACLALALLGSSASPATALPRAAQPAVTEPLVVNAPLLDSFDDPASWQVIVADGVALNVGSEPGRNGAAARLDYDFTRGSGYAIIRKEFKLDLPANYRFSYSIRGVGPRNTLEFKLVDPSGDNVWWVNQRDIEFPADWQTVTLPRRKFSFAWGPSGGAPLRQARYIEMVITSFNGGRGTVWLDDLRFEPLPEVREYAGIPMVRGSTPAGAASPARPIGTNGRIDYRSERGDTAPAVSIDFGQARELGGMIIDWGVNHAADYDVLSSVDGTTFVNAATVRASNGGRDYITLPNTTATSVRIQSLHQEQREPIALESVQFLPPEFADSANALLLRVAADSRRGWYPRYFKGEASYWTVIGVHGDEKEALINEEGAVEVDKLAFSIEPFVYSGGNLLTWENSTNSQSLLDGSLPIPTVRRESPGLRLDVRAFADGTAGASSLLLRYELKNTGASPTEGWLFLAIRPMQVNPPYQNLNITGGAANVQRILAESGRIHVDERVIMPTISPENFGAATFDNGEIIEHLSLGRLPTSDSTDDPRGLASAAMSYAYRLAPGESKVVGLVVPFHRASPDFKPDGSGDASIAQLDARLAAARGVWTELLGRVQIRLPKGNERITDSIRANLAYILINRDGPGIQPGSRSYERTWIRDGALTSTALLSMGLDEFVLEFLDWFAAFQYDNGKIPCCVDRRGPDPVPEHDSHGQYIHAVYTYFTFTGDMAFLRRHYPHVLGAVEYIEFLRHQRMTDEFATGPDDKRVLYGLMPESISHEGYSAKPMHSYWDDFWTLKGLIDAARLAGYMSDEPRETEFGSLRDSFEQTLYESMRLAIKIKGIDFIPGCAELGDFDATSTTVGLFPCGQLGSIPEPQLSNTFERYWKFFQDRRDGKIQWKDYTPYEHRVIGSMVLLGQRDRAHEVLDYFFRDQRPQGWRHWAEVVRREPREPWFIGDMPHTWVGSDFINSVQVMLAYVRDHDQAMIIGAGVPRAWLESAEGLDVANLRTEFGPLSYTTRAANGLITIKVEPLKQSPPGGVHIQLPDADRLKSLILEGREIPIPPDGLVTLPKLPATLELRYTPQAE